MSTDTGPPAEVRGLISEKPADANNYVVREVQQASRTLFICDVILHPSAHAGGPNCGHWSFGGFEICPVARHVAGRRRH